MRKLMWFSIGLALSCIIGIYLLSGSWLLWLALSAGIVFCVLCFIKYRFCKIAGAILLGFCVGVLWMWGYDALYLNPAKHYDGKALTTSIEVTDYSYFTGYGTAADGRIELSGISYRVRVYFDETLDLEPGDRIQGSFTLGMTTPDGQEASDYYQGKGIFLIAETEEDVLVQDQQVTSAKYFAVKLRKQITGLLDAAFPADTLGFARALLLGDSSCLTYEEDTAFKTSGIRHVIAVSGLHVSILFSLVYVATGKRRISTAIFGIPLLLLFAAVAGFTPSIMRACIMQLLMILALLLNKEYDPPTALAFSVLVMLLLNPMTITSVSFQLSVGCMIGIFLFSSRVSKYILRKLGTPTDKSLRARLGRWFASGIAVTLSAMAVTTPLVAWYFGMVSLIGVVANLLTLWVISFVFYGIMLACVCGALWLPLGKIVAWVVSWAIRYVLLAAKVFASVPFAAVYTCSIYIVLWICVSYLLFAVFLLIKKKRPVLFTACILICLIAAVTASCVIPRLDDFRVTVFDVGEGQAVLLQSNHQYYLVDCGGNSAEEAADTVAETLLSQGITSLDGIILTHYDADHAAGVQCLLSRVNTRAIYLPDIPDDRDIKQMLIQTHPDKVRLVTENTTVTEAGSVLTLIPAQFESADENESSLCVLFQPENCDILITGDRGKTGELALLDSFALPKLELLIAGHHGAAKSTSFELLSAVQPDTVAISTGGRYGHPSGDVLYRLELFGCNVWRTDLHGTLIFRR